MSDVQSEILYLVIRVQDVRPEKNIRQNRYPVYHKKKYFFGDCSNQDFKLDTRGGYRGEARVAVAPPPLGWRTPPPPGWRLPHTARDVSYGGTQL